MNPNMVFDPQHSELESNQAKRDRYMRMLEDAIGHRAMVVGAVVIGSHAKGEAVAGSDTDTRVYVVSPECYLHNSFAEADQEPPFYGRFVAERGALPLVYHRWPDLNGPASQEMSELLGTAVEFGFADRRYVEFELSHLDEFPSREHSYLLQSNLLYDPQGIVARWRGALQGKLFPTMVTYYRATHLNGVSAKVYRHLEPDPYDDCLLGKTGQIQWIHDAVRCVRNAVAAQTYITTGTLVYTKPEVLQFYRERLPEHFPLVQQLYEWKTDPAARAAMGEAFRRDRGALFVGFRRLVPELESIVGKVSAMMPGM